MSMVLIMIVVTVLSIGVVGGLFVVMNNQNEKPEENVVPITDISEIKKEIGAFDSNQSTQETSESGSKKIFDRDGFDVEKPLGGIEKEVHDVVEQNRKIVDVPFEKLMEDLNQDQESTGDDKKEENYSGDDVYVAKIQKLQEENESLMKRLNKAVDEKSILESNIKQVEIQSQEKINQAQETIQQFKDEVEHLKKQFTQDDITEIERIRQNYEEQIAELNERIHGLEKDLEKSVQKADHALSNSKKEPIGKNDMSQQRMNEQLMERVQQLQYDITKYKAQITGLEKMCENYKIQIDKFNAGNSSSVS